MSEPPLGVNLAIVVISSIHSAVESARPWSSHSLTVLLTLSQERQVHQCVKFILTFEASRIVRHGSFQCLYILSDYFGPFWAFVMHFWGVVCVWETYFFNHTTLSFPCTVTLVWPVVLQLAYLKLKSRLSFDENYQWKVNTFGTRALRFPPVPVLKVMAFNEIVDHFFIESVLRFCFHITSDAFQVIFN